MPVVQNTTQEFTEIPAISTAPEQSMDLWVYVECKKSWLM